jgi:hypothetical protein
VHTYFFKSLASWAKYKPYLSAAFLKPDSPPD